MTVIYIKTIVFYHINSTLFRGIIKKNEKRPYLSILLISIIPSTSIFLLKHYWFVRIRMLMLFIYIMIDL